MTDELSLIEQASGQPAKARMATPCYFWAATITAVGMACVVFALKMERTAEYSETLNIGLLQDQMMIAQLGIGLLVSGVISIFVSALIDVVERRKV